MQNPPRGNPVQIPGSQPPPRANPWQSQGGAMRGSGGDQGGGRGRPRAFEYVPRGPVSDPTPSGEHFSFSDRSDVWFSGF